MPIPKPNRREKKENKEKQFIQRCMDNETMKKEFPDQKQRYAVCMKQWRQK